jgi:hypothetical protein
MNTLDDLANLKTIHRITAHYFTGYDKPYEWMNLRYLAYTGQPYWEENDQHFRERIKQINGIGVVNE